MNKFLDILVEFLNAVVVGRLLGNQLGRRSRTLLNSFNWSFVEAGSDSDHSVLADFLVIVNWVEVAFWDGATELMRVSDLVLVMRNLLHESLSTLDLLLVELLSSCSCLGLFAEK